MTTLWTIECEWLQWHQGGFKKIMAQCLELNSDGLEDFIAYGIQDAVSHGGTICFCQKKPDAHQEKIKLKFEYRDQNFDVEVTTVHASVHLLRCVDVIQKNLVFNQQKPCKNRGSLIILHEKINFAEKKQGDTTTFNEEHKKNLCDKLTSIENQSAKISERVDLQKLKDMLTIEIASLY